MQRSNVRSSLLLIFSLLIHISAASVLTITIPSSNLLPNPAVLPPSTHATLTTLSPQRALLKAPLSRSSSITFHDLRPSSDSKERTSYLLDIYSRDYVFAPYRVDVGADGNVIGVWETFRGNPWDNKGVEKAVGSGSGLVNFEAKVLAKREFYEEREGFSPLSLFKNPMILLAIFALGVTVGMPYLMDNMDPELREEFEKQRAAGVLPGSGSKSAPKPSFDLAGWMAGTSPGPMEAARVATSTARENTDDMSFAPPSSPPPPQVPEGWKAQYHDGYKQWYFVDLSTGVSQWDAPPVSADAPPSYEASGSSGLAAPITSTTDQKTRPESRPSELESNNPYKAHVTGGSSSNNLAVSDKKNPAIASDSKSNVDDDAKLAAELQEQENERARKQGYDSVLEANNTPANNARASNQNQNYAAISPTPSPFPPQQETTRGKSGKGGFLGKLLNKAKQSSSPRPYSAPPGPPQQQQPGYYPPPQQPYGLAPIQGGYGQPLYQQPYHAGPPPAVQSGRMGGGRGAGMGMAGAAALGLGGGMLGGALLANSFGGHHDYGNGYQDGYADGGGDYGGDYGGDFGGGDFGGGFD
ncbi:medium-chain fatty acid-CoA ligase faa2 [Ophidiomyces ophidiicola]|nr:medium-chain fatty acid-CoA ligase faa2 [Ophidiomyces ophidiicola]